MIHSFLCCLGTKPIPEDFFRHLETLLRLHDAKVTTIKRLSEKDHATDIEISSMEPLEVLSSKLLDLSHLHKIDLILLPDDQSRNAKRLLVFDMDSTLIQQEVINEMAIVHGIGDKVKIITERAMNGELNFEEALRERVALLKGLKREDLISIMDHLKLTDGVQALIEKAHENGYKTAILSGGFNYFANNFKTQLKMNYAYSNELEWKEDRLTGNVLGKIVDAQEKVRLLVEIAEKESIPLKHVVAIGDGANDLPMLAKAGLGLAYHAKEKVRQEARQQINYANMESILYVLGISGDDRDEAASFKN